MKLRQAALKSARDMWADYILVSRAARRLGRGWGGAAPDHLAHSLGPGSAPCGPGVLILPVPGAAVLRSWLPLQGLGSWSCSPGVFALIPRGLGDASPRLLRSWGPFPTPPRVLGSSSCPHSGSWGPGPIPPECWEPHPVLPGVPVLLPLPCPPRVLGQGLSSEEQAGGCPQLDSAVVASAGHGSPCWHLLGVCGK